MQQEYTYHSENKTQYLPQRVGSQRQPLRTKVTRVSIESQPRNFESKTHHYSSRLNTSMQEPVRSPVMWSDSYRPLGPKVISTTQETSFAPKEVHSFIKKPSYEEPTETLVDTTEFIPQAFIEEERKRKLIGEPDQWKNKFEALEKKHNTFLQSHNQSEIEKILG